GKCIQVAIVPDQAVVHVVVAPAGAIPDIYAALGAHPQPPQMVELEKVDNSVGAAPLNALLDVHAAGSSSHTIDAASIAVSDPNSAIRCRAQREYLSVAQ